MRCIFRGLAASRPLIGMHQCSRISHLYPRPQYPNKWFSRSSKLCARPKHYTPEQLAAFTNHYAVLGLSQNAADKDINRAFQSLCMRFHPDMIRNTDSQEYWDNPRRPEFVKIKNSRDFLLDPAKRKPYDAEYNDVLLALKRLLAEREPRDVDSKKTIASHLRLDHPATSGDGRPIRDHCVVQVPGLSPQVTVADLVRAIAEMRPVGRVIDARLMQPSMVNPHRAAFVEFPDDASAQRLGLLASRCHFNVLGKRVWHCKLVDHELMTISAMGGFFNRKINSFDTKQDRYSVMDSAKGPDSVTIECVFVSWRRCAVFAHAALRQEYPELTVTYGQDPCE
ncbi:hypothetical protein INS49_009139 [Diaporthe citri]|uniref:uncharacterized protein n=1 Tax=Diaporthe citri TaxID=83186 RepID=UPI001C810310|nr:uncharacterized protein INS49_009139 [Diaporthe citri]KAG6364036.1 hypothetical protein INS49_009139 [Diaporthe citri]